jgi:hypothetical protein
MNVLMGGNCVRSHLKGSASLTFKSRRSRRPVRRVSLAVHSPVRQGELRSDLNVPTPKRLRSGMPYIDLWVGLIKNLTAQNGKSGRQQPLFFKIEPVRV